MRQFLILSILFLLFHSVWAQLKANVKKDSQLDLSKIDISCIFDVMKVYTDLYHGDCKEELKNLPENSVDLIFTSPPYADQRKNTYGGIHPNKYVDWFLPIGQELLRVLMPTGTFVLRAA